MRRKTNNNITEDLVESKGDESQIADIRRIMIRMFKEIIEELKRTHKKNTMNIKRR
jgi:hypothetical protein